MSARKPLMWVCSSKKDLKQMPTEVQDVFGHALDLAQCGLKYSDAKPMKGFGGAGVLELIEDFDTDTYRAIYTVRFGSAIYVLHCFQKKSKSGIKTAQSDIDLIRNRLRAAQEHAKGSENHGD
ncbi:addiction module toxin RelE [Pseudomonas koreensis]|uniref:Addiction module toxin RelE n=2 Tax=Pseudomonas TaxID=286 RepID=A0A4Q4L9H4_9PSED|nr:addiction module toxin RelE [Pseudomonas koreensis]